MANDGPEMDPGLNVGWETREPLFVEAACWPIEPAALAALIDIGMSDRQIAEYFGVHVADVEALRGRFRLVR